MVFGLIISVTHKPQILINFRFSLEKNQFIRDTFELYWMSGKLSFYYEYKLLGFSIIEV